MDVEIPSIYELIIIDGLQVNPKFDIERDPNIILLGQPSQPSLASVDRIHGTLQPSMSSQLEFTLTVVQQANLSGRFKISLNSKTELSDPVDNPVEEFLDAQGAQLAPTFSDHDLPLNHGMITPFHDPSQILDPSNQLRELITISIRFDQFCYTSPPNWIHES